MSDEPVPVEPAEIAITDDEKTMALLAHVLPIGTGFIGPLIILLIKGEESAFVKYHATQALIFMGIFTVVFVLTYIFTCGLGAILILPLIPFMIAGQIYIGIQAQKGAWMGYPGLEKFGR